MSKVIELHLNKQLEISQRFKAILQKNKKGQRELLTPEKLRCRPGLENLSDKDAKQIIQTIKDLATLFFEIACLQKPSCIDNQHVVSLNQEKKAA